MDRNTLNSFEEKGLPCPFIATREGQVEIAQSGAALSKQVSQMATVLFETIGAVGDIKVDSFDITGSDKRLVISLAEDQLAGTILSREKDYDINAIRTLIEELQSQPEEAGKPVEQAVEKPEEAAAEERAEEEVPRVEEEIEEKVEQKEVVEPEPEPEETIEEPEQEKVALGPEVLDSMKSKMKDFLGDFTERIFKNQIKAQRINADDLKEEDARRLVFALGKAAGMIIGPSKGREMTNKLLELLK